MNGLRRVMVLRWMTTAFLGTAVLVGCGGDSEDSASGLGTVESGTLTVCSDLPYPPFEFEAGGESVGIDIDLMTAIADDLGLTAVIKDSDFDGIFAALAAGQCDVVASSVSITDERRRSNEFTQGYYEIRQSLLVRKSDADRYRSLADLRGRTIGVQSETTGEAYARSAATGVTIRSFTGADELLTALRAGQIDGVLQDFPVNAYNAQSSGDTVVSARLPSDPEQYGFVVKKGNVKLRDAIDEALSRIRSSGRYEEILRRYLGTATP